MRLYVDLKGSLGPLFEAVEGVEVISVEKTPEGYLRILVRRLK